MSKSAKFANIVLGSIAILFLMLFFYTLSESTSYPPGHMNNYYLFSLTGFFFLTIILLKCNATLKVKITLLALSLIFSIYAIEIILSYIHKTNKIKLSSANAAKDLGIPFDSRAPIQVWRDFRKKGIDAYPFHNPTENMYFEGKETVPLGFISNQTVIYCNEGGDYIIYKSDEHGFNNPQGLYNGKSPDIVLIGDSFTQGACVKREENIAAMLIKEGKQVVNLGRGNTGSLYQLAILKEYGKPLKPKIVFWFFYEGNDHEGMILENKSSFFMKYLNTNFTQDLIKKQKQVDDILIEYMQTVLSLEKAKTDVTNQKTIEETFAISLSILKLTRLNERLGISKKCKCKLNPLFKDVFKEAKNTVNEWGGQLYFVYLPSWERYPDRTNYCKKRFFNKGKKELIQIINELQIPVIDIQSVFDSHPDPLSLFPFRIYGHYNSAGYMLVAKHLNNYISKNLENVEEQF